MIVFVLVMSIFALAYVGWYAVDLISLKNQENNK